MKLERKNDNIVAYVCYYFGCIVAGILFDRLDLVLYIWDILSGCLGEISVKAGNILFYVLEVFSFSILYVCVFFIKCSKCFRFKLKLGVLPFVIGCIVFIVSFEIDSIVRFCVAMSVMD